ncbi:MAG: cell division protein ZipA [Pseudomonadota bacterium]
MSNWLTGIIVLLIIAILADGFRRTYNLRRNSIHLSPKMKKRSKEVIEDAAEDAPVESFKNELPNGGARVIGYRDPLEVRQPRKKVSALELREARRKEAAAKRPPEQTRLNLDESVPILMESVEHDLTPQQQTKLQQTPVQQTSLQQQAFSDVKSERSDPAFVSDGLRKQEVSDIEEDDDNTVYDEEDDYEDGDYDEEPDEDELEDGEDDDEYEDEKWEEETEEEQAVVASAPQPEEVIIINVMAFKGESFSGNDLLDVILKCGLRYGSMDIFHRYSDTKGEGALLFSMANMVKPGTFDLDLMDEFETPGVSLFMTLPIDADSMQSFELMVKTANTIADALDGELKDEQRSAMTRQTIEHCRQRISDFERKKLFRRPR